MKKSLLLLLLCCFSKLFGQVPQSFNYQGIARDASGSPLANQVISIRLSIISGTPQGPLIYSEVHADTTNQFGLFVLQVGKGDVISGSFESIAWTESPKFLKTEIDPDGRGFTRELTAVSPLQSVPYALAAKTVETEKQTLSLLGNTLSISQGNSVVLPNGGSGPWVADNTGIYYPSGKVALGAGSDGIGWFQITKNATGADRTFAIFRNTNNTEESITGVDLFAGTGTNENQLRLTVSAKNYFPVVPFSGYGLLTAEKAGIAAIGATAASESQISFITGGNYTDNPNGGAERMRITKSGNIGVGTADPLTKLDINGKLRIQDLSMDTSATRMLVANANGVIGYRNNTTSSLWSGDAYGINYNSGKVSIGTSTGDAQFQIVKNATGTDRVFMRLHNTSDLHDGLTSFQMASGTQTNMTSLDLFVSSKIYFPELPMSGYGILRSENLGLATIGSTANSNEHISFFTGANLATSPNGGVERMRIDKAGNIGIGTSSPAARLDINGRLRIQDLPLASTASRILVADASGVIGYRDVSSLAGSDAWATVAEGINYNSRGKVLIGDATSQHIAALIISKNASGADRSFTVMHNTSDKNDANVASYWMAGTGENFVGLDITVGAKSYFPELGMPGYGQIRTEKLALNATSRTPGGDAFISFITGANWDNLSGGTEKMRLSKQGNLGIGTSDPKAKLHINGSAYVEDPNGIIMKSSGGLCWRITVSDTGTLTTVPVTCP